MIDATIVRVHQHSAGALKKGVSTKRPSVVATAILNQLLHHGQGVTFAATAPRSARSAAPGVVVVSSIYS